MKLNQSLTAAITAAALVAGAGFAYAQTSSPQVTNMPGASSAQGPLQNQGTTGTSGSSGAMNSDSTTQAQPSTSTGGTSMDNSATTSVDTTLEPRADRN